MGLRGVLDLVASDPAVTEAVTAARGGHTADLELVASTGIRPYVLAALTAGSARPLLVITATDREAADLARGVGGLLGADTVAEFPAWETLPHERLSPRADTVGRRLAVLRRLAHPAAEPGRAALSMVVAPVRAVLQPLVSGLGDLEPVVARPGDTLPLEVAVARLVEAGYSRVEMVEARGQIAIRGGILDVFPPTENHPLRVEFFGDEVEEVRPFRVADQRSMPADEAAAPQGLWAPACRELLLTDQVRARAAQLARSHPQLADVASRLAEGIPVEGMEALAPALAEGMTLLVDELPAGAHVVLAEPERVRSRAADLLATSQEFLAASWVNAAAGGQTPIDLGAAAYRSLGEVRTHARSHGVPWWAVTSLRSDTELAEVGDPTSVEVAATDADGYRGDTARVVADVKGWLSAGWRVLMVTEGHGLAARYVEVLAGEGVPVRLVEDLAGDPERGSVTVTCADVEHGFLAPHLPAGPLAVLTELDLAGQRSSTRDMRRMPSRRRDTVDPLTLRPGEPVVHEHHGVGRYVGMTQRTVAGATREYFVIEYAPSKRGAPGDRLYVPSDSLDLLTRYVGGEEPALDRLGGSDWSKRKGRARRAIREIAGELVRLYSARMASPGHAFGPDTPWQRELEDAFQYVETPDQLAVVDEVKADMERPVPMDRIISGDVGYGKTEVAVRAAFKAVMDGKQVAVLVPTTLLVQQHLSTFTERYTGFPIKVAALSRFQSDREAAAVRAGLADGSIDVVIGTHRLLLPEVRFKDLGLVVVDEEQRFGVEHKEYLKQLRTAVDVLTMSATPIPRTLEMSITGIREMSTISTPPEDRHPILTFVGPYDDKQVTAAIRRELLREGQVFYIHNRVETIDAAASRLAGLVPEARIEVAHGQMNEHQLESVIVGFWEKQCDVLVCTTIVENGIDIPNANTLVVERADTFGLPQLHQLRGRVGRGRERAYAYFLYPPQRPLSQTAYDRLSTIAANTALGAGMAVALKDLEIRGSGNLLGGEQSGHIADVGFDLYVRLVGEALADFKAGQGLAGAEPASEPAEVKVELPLDAHFPHEYVPGERLRLEAYRRLASVTTEDEIDEVRAELTDRYGALPAPAETLLAVARFRLLARAVGLTDVGLAGKFVRFAPVDLAESARLRLQRLHPGSVVKAATHTILVPRPSTARLGGEPLRDVALLTWCRELIAVVLARADPTVATASRTVPSTPTSTEGSP